MVISRQIHEILEDPLINKVTITCILFVLLLGCTLFASDEPLCEQVANYTIDAKLNTENKTITANALLSWTNTTDFYRGTLVPSLLERIPE